MQIIMVSDRTGRLDPGQPVFRCSPLTPSHHWVVAGCRRGAMSGGAARWGWGRMPPRSHVRRSGTPGSGRIPMQGGRQM